jgi:hypothetical protein
MATSLDNTQTQGKTEYPAEDVEIAVRMAIKMLNEGNGLQIIANAIQQSKDPAQVIGKFLAQMIGQLAEKLRDEAGINPGIFIAKNGFLDQILDYIETKLKLPPEFSDQVYAEVLDTIKAAARSPRPEGQVSGPGAQPQAAPTAPQAPLEGGA